MAFPWIAGEDLEADDLNVLVPRGAVFPYAGSSAPEGYLICDGSSLLRAGDYAPLFAIIGTTYGAADGTHFNIPNLKGKVPVGLNASETEFDALGETGGAKTHTLETSEIPSHVHGVQGGNFSGSAGSNFARTADASGGPTQTNAAGGGGAHNNLQPYITLNYIIRY